MWITFLDTSFKKFNIKIMIIDTQKLVEMVLEIINDDRVRVDVKLTRVKQLLEKLKIVK